VTVSAHVSPGASVVGHVSVSAKSPLVFTPPIVSVCVPTFFNVVTCDAPVVPTRCEPKSSDDGDRLTAGAGLAPLPLRVSCCGLPAASS
jgi:hypothetical protein